VSKLKLSRVRGFQGDMARHRKMGIDDFTLGAAGRRTLTEIGKRIKTVNSKIVRNRLGFNLKVKDINRYTRLDTSKAKGSASKFSAGLSSVDIVVRSKPYSLMYFRPTGYQGKRKTSGKGVKELKRGSSRRGVFVKIKKGRQTNLKKAFILQVDGRENAEGSTKFRVFVRTGGKLRAVRVLSLQAVVSKPEVVKAFDKVGSRTWAKRFPHNVEFMKNKGFRRG
jgi:hypothetical protein